MRFFIRSMEIMKNFKNKVTYGDITATINPAEYHEFANEEEAERWGHDKYDAWAKGYKHIFHMTSQYKESSPLHLCDPSDMYFGYKYREMNQILRFGATDNYTDELPIYISTLAMAIFSAPVIGEKIVLYRQVSESTVRDIISLNKDRGTPYPENGFMSTSLTKKCCADNCGTHQYMLKMYVDNLAPVHAIYANAVRYRDEEELLLPPGLYLQLTGYPYIDDETGKTIIEVHLFSMHL